MFHGQQSKVANSHSLSAHNDNTTASAYTDTVWPTTVNDICSNIILTLVVMLAYNYNYNYN